MNLVGKSRTDLLFADFNQDFTCISFGTKHGFKMYKCDSFTRCYGKFVGGTGIAEMLFCTSLVALVGAGEQPAFSPRCLQIANTKRQTTICELDFRTAILAVKMNRRRLIVVLEERIHIYDITTMKLLHTNETPPNPKGIVALSPNDQNCYLCYVASVVTGEVLVFDALNLQASTIIQAHKTLLSAMSFNSSGTMLATSSNKGTIIRVFSIPSGSKLYQFRRGAYEAQIYSLSFDISSQFLTVSSATDTVHIFKLDSTVAADKKAIAPQQQQGGSSGGWGSWGDYMSTTVTSYLPEMVNDVWEPQRDFAFLKLPNAGVPNICAISNTGNQVLVASAEGYFYQYSFDSELGGECKILKQYPILDPNEHVNHDEQPINM